MRVKSKRRREQRAKQGGGSNLALEENSTRPASLCPRARLLARAHLLPSPHLGGLGDGLRGLGGGGGHGEHGAGGGADGESHCCC